MLDNHRTLALQEALPAGWKDVFFVAPERRDQGVFVLGLAAGDVIAVQKHAGPTDENAEDAPDTNFGPIINDGVACELTIDTNNALVVGPGGYRLFSVAGTAGPVTVVLD